jgi:hypothetical protein
VHLDAPEMESQVHLDAKSGASGRMPYKEELPITTIVSSEAEKTPLSERQEQEAFKGQVRTYIQNTVKEKIGMLPIWDDSEAKVLDRMFADNPSWTIGDWDYMLQNWANSESPYVRFGDRPRNWLLNISKFADGPMVEFNKRRRSL